MGRNASSDQRKRNTVLPLQDGPSLQSGRAVSKRFFISCPPQISGCQSGSSPYPVLQPQVTGPRFHMTPPAFPELSFLYLESSSTSGESWPSSSFRFKDDFSGTPLPMLRGFLRRCSTLLLLSLLLFGPGGGNSSPWTQRL